MKVNFLGVGQFIIDIIYYLLINCFLDAKIKNVKIKVDILLCLLGIHN